MIHESYYWKKELLKCFVTLAKFRQLQKPSEKSYVNVEKSLMLGAYIIRKLNEAEKIPPNFLDEEISLEFLDNIGNMVDHFNWHKIDQHYNFDNKKTIKKNWKFIINQIIHSFTFFLYYSENDKYEDRIFEGFFINSDKTKKDALFMLPLRDVLTLFLKISEGTITSAHSERKPIKNESGEIKPGPMKLIKAEYSYPMDFNLQNSVINTLNGEIYSSKE